MSSSLDKYINALLFLLTTINSNNNNNTSYLKSYNIDEILKIDLNNELKYTQHIVIINNIKHFNSSEKQFEPYYINSNKEVLRSREHTIEFNFISFSKLNREKNRIIVDCSIIQMKLDMSNIDNDHHFIENNFNNQNLQPSICFDTNINIKNEHDAEAEANDENESDLSMSASVDAVHPGDSESTQEGMSSNHSQQELPAANAVKIEPNTLSPNTNRNKVKEIFQCILCDKR